MPTGIEVTSMTPLCLHQQLHTVERQRLRPDETPANNRTSVSCPAYCHAVLLSFYAYAAVRSEGWGRQQFRRWRQASKVR